MRFFYLKKQVSFHQSFSGLFLVWYPHEKPWSQVREDEKKKA